MRKLLLTLPLFVATPTYATGRLVCRTAGPHPVEVSVGFGHVPGSALILARLKDAGRTVPVTWAQWWLDSSEMRLLLVDPEARKQQVRLKAKRRGHVYDGSLWRGGKRRWVRCREA